MSTTAKQFTLLLTGIALSSILVYWRIQVSRESAEKFHLSSKRRFELDLSADSALVVRLRFGYNFCNHQRRK